VTQPSRRGRAGLPRHLVTITYPGEQRVVARHAERVDQPAQRRAAGRRLMPQGQLGVQVDGADPVSVLAGPSEVTEVARGRGPDRRQQPGFSVKRSTIARCGAPPSNRRASMMQTDRSAWAATPMRDNSVPSAAVAGARYGVAWTATPAYNRTSGRGLWSISSTRVASISSYTQGPSWGIRAAAAVTTRRTQLEARAWSASRPVVTTRLSTPSAGGGLRSLAAMVGDGAAGIRRSRLAASVWASSWRTGSSSTLSTTDARNLSCSAVK
jgi:hypothetical protein